MIKFSEWLIESSLGDELNFPQDVKHHPEGSVRRHTMMVHHSMNKAIELLKHKQSQDVSGVLSNLDLNLNQSDINLLRLSGLLHDIGKGETLQRSTRPDGSEKISHHGHDRPEFFEIAMKRLGPVWQKMYDKSSSEDKSDLWFLITNHMALDDNMGIKNKSLKREVLDDDGKFKNERKIKLLLILFLMDRLGRGGKPSDWQTAKEFIKSNDTAAEKGLSGIIQTGISHKQNIEKILSKQSKSLSKDPQEFVSKMKQTGKDNNIIRTALKGKFKELSDEEINKLLGESLVNFRYFLESKEKEIVARLPLNDDIFALSRIFKDNGFQMYVVGGAPRDFLKHYFSNTDEPFDTNKTKDVDLTTNATPDQVKSMLNKSGIKNFGKGESFGVMVAHIGGEDYEIATFREDLGYSDGRRPDEVRWSDMDTDYKRRDLTMNAIYYEIPSSPNQDGVFIDPSGGQGFEDIKNWVVRMIGDPFERIGEDKLRISRIPRFHSYYNADDIRSVLDQPTLDAIEKYKDLRTHGVTGPRIQQEFWSGLKKSHNTVSYLRNYDRLGLLSSVFPGLELDMDSIDLLSHPEIHDTKHHSGENKFNHSILVISLLLRKNSPEFVRSSLNKLEWPNEVSDGVEFLLRSWQHSKNPSSEIMSKIAQEISKKPSRKEIIKRSKHIIDSDHLSHLGEYIPPVYSGSEIQKELGLKKPGPEIGMEMKRRLAADYQSSFEKHKNKTK